jgi:hypothetical protein
MSLNFCWNRTFPEPVAAGLLLVLIGICFFPQDGNATGLQAVQEKCRQSLLTTRNHGSETPIVVTMEELQKNPQVYYGRMVTVDGELHRTFTDSVFTIEGSGSLKEKDVLVISTVPRSEAAVSLKHSPGSGNDVRITGVVQPYDRAKLECAFGPLHLDRYEGHAFTRNPVLIVDRKQPEKSETPPAQQQKPASEPQPAKPATPPARPMPPPEPAPQEVRNLLCMAR